MDEAESSSSVTIRLGSLVALSSKVMYIDTPWEMRKPNTPTRWTNTHHCNTRQRPPGRAVEAILAGDGQMAGSAGRRWAVAGLAVLAVAGGRRSPEGDGRQDLHRRQSDGDHHVPLESLGLVEDGEPHEGPGKGEPHAGPRRGVERVEEMVAEGLGIESDRRPLEDRANPQQAQEDGKNRRPHPHRSSPRFADRSSRSITSRSDT